MNKTTKGSLAAGAAAVLLLGGAGSLAYWTDGADVDAGTINSGFLTLDNGVCDTDWVYAADQARAGDTVVNFVPGDVVTKDCDFVINAEGDNLAATPTVSDTVEYTVGGEPGEANPGTGATFFADVVATYTVNGDPYDAVENPITENAADQPLVASIVVTIPFGTDELGNDLAGNPAGPIRNANDTQNIAVDFEELSVSLEQINPNP